MKRWVEMATIAQAIMIPIAAIAVLTQWSQQNSLARASNAQALAAQAAEFNYKLLENEKGLELWYAFGKQPSATAVDKLRYREFLVQWLIFHENVYQQHKAGLLDDNLYKSWDVDLRYVVKNHDIKSVGFPLDQFFPTPYGAYLQTLQNAK